MLSENNPQLSTHGLSNRNAVIMLVVGGYLILNYLFMQLRLPPGSGVPLGEIILLSSLCFFVKDVRLLPSFTNNLIFIVYLAWWGLGIGRALYAFPEFGMWALRDASHVIESLFLWVGFVFASTPGAVDHFFVWLRRILWLGCLYAFSYPFRDTLSVYMPTLVTPSGRTSSIFHPNTYNTSAGLLLWEATRRLIGRTEKSLLIPSLLVLYAVTIFQARTIYLQVIAILLLLMWYRPGIFKKFTKVLGIGLVILVFFVGSGIEVKGRLGEKVSLDFIVHHFYAIAGIESEGMETSAKGVDLRITWWKDIAERLMKDSKTMLFGEGYGLPLIDFLYYGGVTVREPHNSTMSMLGRSGLVGYSLFVFGHILLLRAWFRAFALCRQKNYQVGQERLILLMVYFILVWVLSLGEDGFERPFLAIPYYFFWGIFLQYRLQLKQKLTDEGLKSGQNMPAQPVFPKL